MLGKTSEAKSGESEFLGPSPAPSMPGDMVATSSDASLAEKCVLRVGRGKEVALGIMESKPWC